MSSEENSTKPVQQPTGDGVSNTTVASAQSDTIGDTPTTDGQQALQPSQQTALSVAADPPAAPVTPVAPVVTTAAMDSATAVAAENQCSNCGHPMDGPFCGQCGQHEKSVIRFFGSVVMHFLDDIFGWDSRAGRTIVPLLFRPGFLTNEYIKGRRVHYVPPLRMYFIVSIIFFLALGFFTDDSVKELSKFQQSHSVEVADFNEQITTLQDKMAAPDYQQNESDKAQLESLIAKRDESLTETLKVMEELQQEIDQINQKRSQPGYVEKPEHELQLAAYETSLAMMTMNIGSESLEQKLAAIDAHMAKLETLRDAAKGEGAAAEAPYVAQIEGLKQQRRELEKVKEASPQTNELVGIEVNGGEPEFHFKLGKGFSFLTKEQNERLMDIGIQMELKAKAAFEQDAGPLIRQILSVLPQAMFVLLPIFALLLKLVYLFSRRFYMEHLTVALHSHAFIFVNLLVLAMLSTTYDWLAKPYPELASWVELALSGFALWIPIYLFLMQKRVYRQGIFMTTIKFFIVGFFYILLLSFTIAATAFWGLYKL